jgi:hypothetical protein
MLDRLALGWCRGERTARCFHSHVLASFELEQLINVFRYSDFLLQAKNDLRGDNSTFYLGTGLPLQHFSRCPSDRHPWPQQR